MSRAFSILLDLADPALASYALETALSLETSGPLFVVEAHPPVRPLAGEGCRFAVAVFDDASRSLEEVRIISSARRDGSGLPFVAVHIGGEDTTPGHSRVIGMTKDVFEESFLQLLAFCYITYLVKGVITDAREML